MLIWIENVCIAMSSNNKQRQNDDDDLINNILPSYHMYQSTISKNLTPTNENFRVDPPMYEMTPVNSISTTPSLSVSQIHSPTSNLSVDEFPFPTQQIDEVFDGESANIWENTILANVHKLPNLSKSDNRICQDLEIDIKVTEKVCQKGVKPTIIDPLRYEFKQGDYIHGYVTMKNKSPVPMLFDMVYVVFEGTLVVLENNRGLIDINMPSKMHKFLNMLDLFASWSYANIDRLATDNGDPHDWCDGETDPFDNTVLSIDVKRFFQPNVTYKRFFTFRIPEKLLDNTCEGHIFSSHTEIPPSLGVPRATTTTPSSLLVQKSRQFKDFSIIDASISYSVEARVIGKASDYKHTQHRDQYVIAKEAVCNIRVVPNSNMSYIYNSYSRNQESFLYYKAFVDSVKSKIEYGNDLLNLPSDKRDTPEISPLVSRDGSFVKLRQLYTMTDGAIKRKLRPSTKQFLDEIYQCLAPYKKKSLTGSSKVLGVVSLSTPKQEYRTLYVPPIKFRKPNEVYNNTKMTIPLEISYFHTKSPGKEVQFPDIKYIKTELVALTLRSQKYPIPLEFNHEMCFKEQEIYDRKHEPENFDTIIISQFQSYLSQLRNLIHNLGNHVFRVETQLVKDMKALATLSTKYINLQIPNFQLTTKSPKSHSSHTSLSTIPWDLVESTLADYKLFSKNFDLHVDLNDCQMKGPSAPSKPGNGLDHLTLVPSFQNCLMSRLYYLKVSIKLNTGELLTVNAPVQIEN